jgi:hypothetical protein
MKLSSDRRYFLIPGGGLAGIVLGLLIALVALRPTTTGAVVSLLSVGGVLAVAMSASGLAGMLIAYLGFFALAPFLVALWITIASLGRSRAGPVPMSQPQEDIPWPALFVVDDREPPTSQLSRRLSARLNGDVETSEC